MEHNGKEYIEKENHDFEELREIITVLRSEHGCKWDKAQTHETLKKCLMDECEEVLQAIDKKDDVNLCEELGDVLLQVLLNSEIAKEQGTFTLDDVIQTLSEKLIRRHPHVFGDVEINTPEESQALWNEIKRQEKEQTHKRRVRYSGTHPRNYKEKYKELQPEKYADTVEKVIQKGSTPVGMHISICVKEILEFLQIKPGQKGLDATLGYGGHTLEMLKCLEMKGHMYALDVDPIEIVKTRERLERLGYGEDILTINQTNFANIDEVAAQVGLFDFMLADLGVSSMQIDNPERGFSYKTEGPLDLRLNPEKGISAAERLKNISKEELQGMLIENADEPYAKEIAQAIISKIKKGMQIDTTKKLRDIIEDTLTFVPADKRKEVVKKTCQRTFQALRIDVNSEFEVLEEFLEKLPNVLAKDGRVAILTFHSGEDRLVKKSFKQLLRQGVYREVSTEVIRPSAEECNRNPRARSTKMRWAIKA